MSQEPLSVYPPNSVNDPVIMDASGLLHLGMTEFGPDELSVYVVNESGEYTSNAIQGIYSLKDATLTFTPFFPFEEGIPYVIRSKDPKGGFTYRSFEFERKVAIKDAKVLDIFPKGNSVPENLLRFYIYFNTPMQKGQALKYIHLVDAEGNEDQRAFMEFKQELWSADGKRLTLLFDPGRIKRGVSTNMELGPALLKGNEYQLIVSEEWMDVHGQTLSFNASKRFKVTDPYRQPLSLDVAEIQKPAADTSDSLCIRFDRIMDHALVQSMLSTEDASLNAVPGSWELSSTAETTAIFVPEKAWKKGQYRIVLNGDLEDISGNNLNGLLDKQAGQIDTNRKEEFTLHFTI